MRALNARTTAEVQPPNRNVATQNVETYFRSFRPPVLGAVPNAPAGFKMLRRACFYLDDRLSRRLIEQENTLSRLIELKKHVV
jgi:hypothetical protein